MSQGAELVENAAKGPHIAGENINKEVVIHSHQTVAMYWCSPNIRLVNQHMSCLIAVVRLFCNATNFKVCLLFLWSTTAKSQILEFPFFPSFCSPQQGLNPELLLCWILCHIKRRNQLSRTVPLIVVRLVVPDFWSHIIWRPNICVSVGL